MYIYIHIYICKHITCIRFFVSKAKLKHDNSKHILNAFSQYQESYIQLQITVVFVCKKIERQKICSK